MPVHTSSQAYIYKDTCDCWLIAAACMERLQETAQTLNANELAPGAKSVGAVSPSTANTDTIRMKAQCTRAARAGMKEAFRQTPIHTNNVPCRDRVHEVLSITKHKHCTITQRGKMPSAGARSSSSNLNFPNSTRNRGVQRELHIQFQRSRQFTHVGLDGYAGDVYSREGRAFEF